MSSSTIDMESDHGKEFEEKRVTRKIDRRILPVLWYVSNTDGNDDADHRLFS